MFVGDPIRPTSAQKSGVTWTWQRSDAGILLTVDVEDPEVIEVRGWATSDTNVASAAAMVYGVGLPSTIGMVWPKDSNPTRIWLEVVKAVGVENPPVANQVTGIDTDAHVVSSKLAQIQ
jgi:hypothetical protein